MNFPLSLASQANSGKNTNSSQFFLCLDNMPSLDGDYVIFGQVANQEGMDVLDKINAVAGSKVDVTISGCGTL